MQKQVHQIWGFAEKKYFFISLSIYKMKYSVNFFILLEMHTNHHADNVKKWIEKKCIPSAVLIWNAFISILLSAIW
jgi:hypothetical protein